MNCDKCNLEPACFLQPQIRSLAGKMVEKPFYSRSGRMAAKAKYGLDSHSNAELRMYDILSELTGIIASNCTLYSERQ